MNTGSDSPFAYRHIAITTFVTGIVLAVVGFTMGGFTSVTWAGVMGAGIALTLHGLFATIGSFVISSRPKQSEQNDAE